MEQKETIKLPEELAAKLRSVATRRREIETTIKMTIKAALATQEELAYESDEIWLEIAKTMGVDIHARNWSANMAFDGSVVISAEPIPVPAPTPVAVAVDQALVAQAELKPTDVQ